MRHCQSHRQHMACQIVARDCIRHTFQCQGGSIEKSPLAVRRSAARCPPTPSFAPMSCASERIYVPLLEWMSNETTVQPDINICDGINFDRAGLHLDFNTLPCEFVCAFALHLDCGMSRGNLLLFADKGFQRGADIGFARPPSDSSRPHFQWRRTCPFQHPISPSRGIFCRGRQSTPKAGPHCPAKSAKRPSPSDRASRHDPPALRPSVCGCDEPPNETRALEVCRG